ncbi:MAG: DUF1580 domain-containing protein [Planctomycetia bacterium]|nr:DUF1580 domain-containing protein [Planctomycetia bacterium]
MAEVVSEIPSVLSEIQAGGGLSLSAAGRLFPAHRGTGTIDPSTVFRWVTKGAKTPNGSLVKLEAVRVGGRWLTSRGAIARFVAALTPNTDTTPAGTPPVSATAARRRAEAAGRELERRGA